MRPFSVIGRKSSKNSVIGIEDLSYSACSKFSKFINPHSDICFIFHSKITFKNVNINFSTHISAIGKKYVGHSIIGSSVLIKRRP